MVSRSDSCDDPIALFTVANLCLRMIDDDPKVNGNLTGSAVTLDVGLARLMRYAGLPPEEAVRWCSLNPATTLGLDRETGSLRAGKRADIVLMDGRVSVRRTILAGCTVFER
jgi:N-acetylglucosamine-6-phosphate deacetylase